MLFAHLVLPKPCCSNMKYGQSMFWHSVYLSFVWVAKRQNPMSPVMPPLPVAPDWVTGHVPGSTWLVSRAELPLLVKSPCSLQLFQRFYPAENALPSTRESHDVLFSPVNPELAGDGSDGHLIPFLLSNCRCVSPILLTTSFRSTKRSYHITD